MNRGLSIRFMSLIIATFLVGQAFCCEQGPNLVLYVYGAIKVDNYWYAPVNKPIIFDLICSTDDDDGDKGYIAQYEWHFPGSAYCKEWDYYNDLGVHVFGQAASEGEDRDPYGVCDARHTHTFTQTGTYPVTLKVYDNDMPGCIPPGNVTSLLINIVILDIDISGNPTVPTLIAVNHDDDNNNHVPDNSMNEFDVDNENELVSIMASITPADKCDGVGYYKLSVVRLDGILENDLAVYSTQTKANRYVPNGSTFYCTFQEDDFPYQSMWVEALQTDSGYRYIQLEYFIPGYTDYQGNMKAIALKKSCFRICKAHLKNETDSDRAVPKYLFAKAEYATPIQFEVTGLGSEVHVSDIGATLYLKTSESPEQWTSCPILIGSDRFIASGYVKGFPDAAGNQHNNEDDVYTAFVNHNQYNGISLGDKHRTNGAYFMLRATVQAVVDGVPNGPSVTVVSAYGDPDMDMFFDKEIFAVEPGIPGVHPDGVREYTNESITSGLQACVDLEGQGRYIHYARGTLDPYYCHPTPWPVPHEEPVETEEGGSGRAGMEYLWGLGDDAYAAEGGFTLPYTISAWTRLYDDNDAFEDPYPPYDVGCKASFWSLRRGGYFCVSYGGKTVAVLNGEYAMDLNKTDTEYDWELFSTGWARYTQNASAGQALKFSQTAALGTGILSLVAMPFSIPASGAFTVLSVAFGVIDYVDQPSPSSDDQALGMMSWAHLKNIPSQEDPTYTQFIEWPQYGYATTPWIQRIIKVEEKNANVGDKLTMFIELESESSSKSRMIESIDVNQKTDFKCDSLTDFNTMTIRIKDD